MTVKELIKKINAMLKELSDEYDRTHERNELGLARVYGMLDILNIIDPKDYCILRMRVTYRDPGNGAFHDAYVNAPDKRIVLVD